MNTGTKFASGSRQNYAKAKAVKDESPLSCCRILLWITMFFWFGLVIHFLVSGDFGSLLLISTGNPVPEDNPLKPHGGAPINYVPAPVVSISAESNIEGTEDDFHVIFSTDCGTFQDWQSLVLFHSASLVGQKGPITRIASGCDDVKKKTLTQLYKKLYPMHRIHFTPDFKKDEKSQQSYDFYNKPWGVKHWLANAEPPIPDGVTVALIDPDMIFLRPLIKKIRGTPNLLYDQSTTTGQVIKEIALGKPVAQMYGLGAPWTNDYHKKFNRTKICGVGSPCLKSDEFFGEAHFAVGPPYIMVKQDLVRLTKTWTEFVPRVFEGYPYLLAEMYAYSMAAAHENLPHFQMYNYMVSAIDATEEGWAFIETLDDVCVPPVNGVFFPEKPQPNLLHYCQIYRVGGIGFTKREVPKNIFSCSHPMLVDPPKTLINALYRIKDGSRETMKPKTAKRNAYMICVIHRVINSALADYKKKMCDPEDINSEKTFIVMPHG